MIIRWKVRNLTFAECAKIRQFSNPSFISKLFNFSKPFIISVLKFQKNFRLKIPLVPFGLACWHYVA